MAGGTALIGAAYIVTMVAGAPPAWAPWGVAIGGSATSVALFVLGAASRGPVGRGTALLLAALGLVIAGSFSAALSLAAPAGDGARLVLGLPLRLAIVFYGVGFIPLFVLPIAFARTFARKADR
jgi:hypothetical protein